LVLFYRGVSVPIWSRTELRQDLGVTRHPVTSQRSAEEHMARTVPGTSLPDQPMSGIASWVETHCRILSFRQEAAQIEVHAGGAEERIE
jgi:hypothetical protein